MIPKPPDYNYIILERDCTVGTCMLIEKGDWIKLNQWVYNISKEAYSMCLALGNTIEYCHTFVGWALDSPTPPAKK